MRYNPETIEDVEFAKEQIEEQYEAMQGFMKDLINISQIDWDEIRENVQKELDIQAQIFYIYHSFAMIKLRNYNQNTARNANYVQIGTLRLYFSYDTIVAFEE